MSTTEVAKFDPSTYVDKVRDKIKQSLIDIIPDDQWNAMLKAEISSFFEPRVERGNDWSTSDTTKPSEFHRIVLAVLEEETKAKIRGMLASAEWSSYWDGAKFQAGEEIARIAKEQGAAIMAKWLEAAIAQVIESVRFSSR